MKRPMIFASSFGTILVCLLGTGLSVSAMDSGPYTNITFDLGSASGVSTTHCASINGLTSTLGIHGLTCLSENNDPPAAVVLDWSNNFHARRG